MAVPFDPQRLTVTGAPVSVVEGVVQSPTTGAAQYSISATGSLVYVPGTGVQAAPSRLVWVDRKGVEQALPQPPRVYANSETLSRRAARGRVITRSQTSGLATSPEAR